MIESDKTLKIVILGEMGVGKTSIIKRFVFNTIPVDNNPTIGIDYVSKSLDLLNGTKVHIDIWDTGNIFIIKIIIKLVIKSFNQ